MKLTATIVVVGLIIALAYSSLNSVTKAADPKDGAGNVEAVLAALRSDEIEKRRGVMRDFAAAGPELYGADATTVIHEGLSSDDSEIQTLALASLHRLAAFNANLANADTFKADVMRLLTSSNKLVSAQASVVSASLYSEYDDVSAKVLDRALSESDRDAKAAYLRQLPPSRVDSPDVRGELLTLARGPADIVSVAAANALLRGESLPPELLPELVRLVQDKSSYGRQSLVRGIARYGGAAAAYAPLLDQVRRRLEHEMTLDYSDRSVNVSRSGSVLNVDEDPGAIDALEQAISSISEDRN